jgi:hypothetical protein
MIRTYDNGTILPDLNNPLSEDPEELPAPPGRSDPELAGDYRGQGNLPEPDDLAPVYGKDLPGIAEVSDTPLYPHEHSQLILAEDQIEIVFPLAGCWQHQAPLSANLFSLIKRDERLSSPGHVASPDFFSLAQISPRVAARFPLSSRLIGLVRTLTL